MSDNLITHHQQPFEVLAADILDQAKKAGATQAEVSLSTNQGLVITSRLGKLETLEHTQDKAMGLTVYFGHQRGSASTTDQSPQAIKQALQAACQIARSIAADDCVGLADPSLMATDIKDLSLYHPWNQPLDDKIALTQACEAHALEQPGITNSDGTTLNSHEGYQLYANSHGFVGAYPTSRHSISCVVIAGEQDEMKRDHHYTVARDPLDMDDARTVAQAAVDKTVSRCHARSIKTTEAPVIYKAELARGILGSFLAAISGHQLYKKASFLLDSLDHAVFPSWLDMYEDPFIQKGLASAHFDDEGVATRASYLVQQGILKTYILSSYTARKLGLQTTGHAGGVCNINVSHCGQNLQALIKDMHRGFLVTELMGHGTNLVTGDYSQGAAGFWVEQGEIQFPVEGVTIASNLKNMYQGIAAIANDVDLRGSVRTGSVLVDRMTIAGG